MTESAVWRIVLRGILVTFALIAVALLLGQLQAVIVQFTLAILLAAAANPLVDGLTVSGEARRRRFRIARGLAALLVFLAGLLLLFGGAVVIVATVGPDLRALAISAPGIPSNSPPHRIASITATGCRSTARDITRGTIRLFSSC